MTLYRHLHQFFTNSIFFCFNLLTVTYYFFQYILYCTDVPKLKLVFFLNRWCCFGGQVHLVALQIGILSRRTDIMYVFYLVPSHLLCVWVWVCIHGIYHISLIYLLKSINGCLQVYPLIRTLAKLVTVLINFKQNHTYARPLQ